MNLSAHLNYAAYGIVLVTILLILVSVKPMSAQEGFTIEGAAVDTMIQKKHSPKKASIYSALLPGLGQGYNKKYWKIPIIYAGFGVFGYMIKTNNQEFKKFKEAYLWKVGADSIAPPDNDYIWKYETADQLKRGMEYYLRNLELSWILAGVWYALNIIDATVDAHLMDYDINEDLTLRIDPGLVNDKLYLNQPVAGMTVTLKF